MVELVSAIANSLVEHPEAVEVSEFQSNGTTVIQLKVAAEDMGKVIGKQGRIAKAIRTVGSGGYKSEGQSSSGNSSIIDYMKGHMYRRYMCLCYIDCTGFAEFKR